MNDKTIFPRLLARWAAVVLLFLLVFIFLSAEAQEERWSATIKRVIDGNTLLTADEEKLRLIDIRLPPTPELRDSLVKFLKKRVEGKEVLLEKDYQERDEDGALLVYVYLGDDLLNAEVLARGLALMERRTLNVKYQVPLMKSQASAFRESRGIWVGGIVSGVGLVEGKITTAPSEKEVVISRPVRYERVEKEALSRAERINNEGVRKAAKGDLEGAMADWEAAARLVPRPFEPHYNLLRAMIEKRLYRRALSLLNLFMEKKPEDAQLYTIRGLALLELGRHEEAREQQKKALSLNPGFFEARLNMARTYEAMGNLKRAIREYERAVDLSPFDPYLHFTIGSLYRSLGEEDKAQESFDMSLENSLDEDFTSKVYSKLEDMKEGKEQAAENLQNALLSSVVQVQVTRLVPHPEMPRTRRVRRTFIGAGFITGRGEILTSARLVSGAKDIDVRPYDPKLGRLSEKSYPARVLITRRMPLVSEVPFLDFALIRMISPPRGLGSLKLGSASEVDTEDTVYTMGYPGSKAHKLIEGSITEMGDLPANEKQRLAMLKKYPRIKASPLKKVKLLVTDFSINSNGQLQGAPLVNGLGNVIGINVVGLPGYESQSISLDIDSVRKALGR